MTRMLGDVTYIIERFGYIAIVFIVFGENLGLPFPGETIAIAAGAAAAAGKLQVLLVWFAVVVGAVIGDNAGFAIGRFGGRPVILRYGPKVGITAEHYARTERFFDRYGGPAVVVARFVPVVRVVSALVIGASGMEWRLFIPWQVAGALLWATVTVGLGFAGDKALTLALPMLMRDLGRWWPAAVIAVLALAAVAYWLIQRAISKRTNGGGGDPA